MAQVIRDAIAAYRVQQPYTAVEFLDRPTVIMEESGEVSGNARGKAPYANPESSPVGMVDPAQPGA